MDVAVIWLMWHIVMPAIGIAALVVILGLVQWWAARGEGK